MTSNPWVGVFERAKGKLVPITLARPSARCRGRGATSSTGRPGPEQARGGASHAARIRGVTIATSGWIADPHERLHPVAFGECVRVKEHDVLGLRQRKSPVARVRDTPRLDETLAANPVLLAAMQHLLIGRHVHDDRLVGRFRHASQHLAKVCRVGVHAADENSRDRREPAAHSRSSPPGGCRSHARCSSVPGRFTPRARATSPHLSRKYPRARP